jgi:membrane-bound ClpP family serine protease
MSLSIIAVLIVVGFLFLLLEILVLPGTSVAGIIGFVLIAIGVWQAYAVHGTMVGTLTLAGSVVFSVVALYFSLKSNTWKRASLNKSIDGKVNTIAEGSVKVGDTGISISRLVPMGKAKINNEFFEVKTLGGFVDEGTEIEVIEIDFNKITVKPK